MYKFFAIFFLILAQFVQGENQGENNELLSEMSNYLVPVQVKNSQKKRYGNKMDGGYVIIEGFKYDGFYGYGVGNDVSFEEELITSMSEGIVCHLYDHTIEKFPSNNPRLIWHKQGVGPYNQDGFQTIESLLKSNHDISKNSLFLKMDIEGAEWHTILNTPTKILGRFKQIVLEFHGLCGDSWGVDLKTKVKVLKKMKKLFHIVHVHGNNNVNGHKILLNGKICFIPDVLEVTYLRKDKDIEVLKSSQKYPIEGIDYPNNPSFPELQLDTFPFSPES